MNTVAKLIARYGNTMTLYKGDTAYPIRAFIQESYAKGQNSVQTHFDVLGQVDRGVYLYIGPVEPMAQEGDRIAWQERHFVLRKAEPMYLDDRVLYCWGLCVQTGGEDSWGK